MAQPSTELIKFRERTTTYLDFLDNIRGVLAPIMGAGTDNSERGTFFDEFFTANPDYDITSAELFAAVQKLQDLETWIDTNLPVLAKVRK